MVSASAITYAPAPGSCYTPEARRLRTVEPSPPSEGEMRKKLTQKICQEHPRPKTGQLDIWDYALPGFGLRLSYGGARAFNVMVKIDGKKRREPVGNQYTMNLDEAREKGRRIMRDAERGISRKDRKRIDDLAERKARLSTFGKAASQYMDEKGFGEGSETWRLYHHDIEPALGDLPIKEFERGRAIIKDLHSNKALTAPVAANRGLGLIKRILNNGHRDGLIDHMPNLDGIAAEETPRKRWLNAEELPVVWRAAERAGWPYGNVVKMLMLTAARRQEVTAMTWDEIGKHAWTLPAERAKNGEEHVIPLTPQMRAVLDDCPTDSSTRLVFPVWRRGEAKLLHPGGERKRRLDKLVAEERVIPPWTLHDLRRSAATHMQELCSRCITSRNRRRSPH